MITIARGSDAWEYLFRAMQPADVHKISIDIRGGGVAIKINERAWTPTLPVDPPIEGPTSLPAHEHGHSISLGHNGGMPVLQDAKPTEEWAVHMKVNGAAPHDKTICGIPLDTPGCNATSHIREVSCPHCLEEF